MYRGPVRSGSMAEADNLLLQRLNRLAREDVPGCPGIINLFHVVLLRRGNAVNTYNTDK